MDKRVLISGATGFIGEKLAYYLFQNGYKLAIISRNSTKSQKVLHFADKHIEWDGERISGIDEVINSTQIIINLAGASIAGKKWTSDYKKEILSSRLKITNAIVKAVNESTTPPNLFISASGSDYYGDTGDNTIDESSPTGKGFLSDVTKAWEGAASKLRQETKLAIIRMGVVLDLNGGALAKMLPAFKNFAGGPLGSGSQWFPWIHIQDVFEAVQHIIENNISGAINLVAPEQVRMIDFAKALGQALNRPANLKVPEFALKLMLGEAAEMLLGSHKIIPKVLIESGYQFKYPKLQIALDSILKSRN